MRGALLRACRRRAGWTQAQLAEAVGCDPGTISRYEHGQIAVPDDVLAAAGWALGAIELLQVAGMGPFAIRFDPELAEAVDWVEEEAEEAIEALRRIARAVRRGEPVRIEDAEQVVDLLPAISAVLGAMARAGIDLAEAARRHEAKVRERYLLGGGGKKVRAA